ncbi:peptidylprolyl isomerase [Muricauda sp. 334s03]|uniref:Peptidylprolyl isomerase n=1 Tax=Flagellimonas yonaguniensis TaxID=3031325 RepID=A0ABT5Y4I2_9FLAO|nr:peptidylprolyl isomerase [[Muricauda] yonaguniensis]MDF0718258.1 peptidylprolyl isomerase [[Muricauda] yonaguniensis]
MKKIKYSILAVFVVSFCFGQNNRYESIIKSIDNQNQVDSVQLNNPCFSLQRIVKTTSDSGFEEFLRGIELGKVKEFNKSYYRILHKKTKKEFKVKYIWLDGGKMSSSEIRNTKKEIFSRYRNGEDFGNLADEFSMDPNKNQGNLGWFPEGRMVPEFERSIAEHKKNEIFESIQKDRNWHFVVLKTHNERETGEFEYLKLSEIEETFTQTENEKDKFIRVDKPGKLTHLRRMKLTMANGLPRFDLSLG